MHGTSRRIGEILRSHGFASEQALEDASAEQERTGQPLGQILVQNGVITRLELASALAEQWADQSAAMVSAAPPPVRELDPGHGDEDARYAARLEAAVGELTRRVSRSEVHNEQDPRFTEMASRLEATVARTQRIEATVATLAESLDGVRGGVEETFAALQETMGALATDLATIDAAIAKIGPDADDATRERFDQITRRVEELARATPGDDLHGAAERLEARIELLAGTAAPAAELEAQSRLITELHTALTELVERPDLHPELDARLARLEAELAHRADAPVLHEHVERLEARIELLAGTAAPAAELEAQSRLITELHTALTELVERPDLHPELDVRLARLEAELAHRADAPAESAIVGALTERLEATSGAQEVLATSVDLLDARVEELSRRSEASAAAHAGTTSSIDQHSARVEALAERLDETAATQGELATSIDDHSARVEALADRLQATAITQGRLTTAIDRHNARIDALAEHLRTTAATQDDIAASVDSLAARVEASATAQHSLAASFDDHDSRVEALSERLEVTTVGHDGFATAIDGLASRVEELAVRQADAATSASRTESLADRLVEMERMFAAVREEMGALPAAALADRLDQLATRVDEIAVLQADDDVAAAVGDLEARLRSELVTSDALAQALARHEPQAAEPDERIDELARDLVTLRGDLAEIARSLRAPHPEQPTMPQLDQIARRLEALENRVTHDVVGNDWFVKALTHLRAELTHDPTVPTPETEELRQSVDEVVSRLGRLESLALRVETLAAAVKGAAPADSVPTTAELHDEIAAHVAELGRTLVVRRPTYDASTAAPADQPDDLEQTLERTRMALERIGLQLGEHDRALAELMRTRVVTQRLDELAARLDDLAAAAPAPRRNQGESGAATGEVSVGMQALMNRIEDVEQSYERDREKLMTRLERMASALDWRLQRLESGNPG